MSKKEPYSSAELEIIPVEDVIVTSGGTSKPTTERFSE